jgi:phage baseplate assembly protein W
MSTEITQPFQLTPSGQVLATSNPNVQAEQHVTTLVSTQPGERVMQPTYGVSLNALVFAPNAPAVVTTIQQDVTNAVNTWEPSLTVNSVTPVPGTDPTLGQAAVTVDYTPGALPGAPGAGVFTATVLIGGAVISDGS